jgi:diadenosine tetraphosphate (Ap4A) HIT family hydrolase
MAAQTIFDKIIDGSIPSYKVWEDDQYLAFLTPFANTPGATVVIPKQNPGGYVFDMDDEAIAGLMTATKQVANLLKKAFAIERVAAVFEGQEVAHVHVKLYPMHQASTDFKPSPQQDVFFPQYPGYITTMEGPRMSDEQLAAIQQKVLRAAA